MVRRRDQVGGNFKGKKHQCSKPNTQDGGIVGDYDSRIFGGSPFSTGSNAVLKGKVIKKRKQRGGYYAVKNKLERAKLMPRLKGNQRGGAIGAGLALGMLAPLVLGAAGKILPGIFGKKKAVTNNNYGNQQTQRPQRQQRQQQYRPPPQYRPQYRPPPPPQYYQPTPQYRPQYRLQYRPSTQYQPQYYPPTLTQRPRTRSQTSRPSPQPQRRYSSRPDLNRRRR